MTETASLIELVWTVLSLAGLLTCWWLLNDAIKSRNYWEARGVNGGVEITTRANVRATGVRTVKQVCYVLIGLTALTLPGADYDQVEPAVVLHIIPVLFLTVQIINVTDAVLARRSREMAIQHELRRTRQKVAAAEGNKQ